MKLIKKICFAVCRRIRRLFLRLLFPDGMSVGYVKFYLAPLIPLKIKSRHIEITLLHSVDVPSEPTSLLVETSFSALRLVPQIHLDETEARLLAKRGVAGVGEILDFGFSPNIWPGEHYRLLNGLIRALDAKRIIEIGTYWGMGTLAMKEALISGGQVTTYDVFPWDAFPETLLKSEDFTSGKVVQVVGDLQKKEFFEQEKYRFEEADLIFLDAAKDGVMERVFLQKFSECRFKKRPLLVIDDIKLWNMLDIWEGIKLPKIDITGFGHYTGTGLVDLRPKQL